MTTAKKLLIITLITTMLGAHQLTARIISSTEVEEFLDALEDDLGLEIINVHYLTDAIAIEAIGPNQMDWHLQIPKWFVFKIPEENHQEPVEETEAMEITPDEHPQQPAHNSEISENPVAHEVSTCPICFENFDGKDIVSLATPCNHTFCIECSKKTFEEYAQNCPLCRKEVSGEEFQKMLTDSTSKL